MLTADTITDETIRYFRMACVTAGRDQDIELCGRALAYLPNEKSTWLNASDREEFYRKRNERAKVADLINRANAVTDADVLVLMEHANKMIAMCNAALREHHPSNVTGIADRQVARLRCSEVLP